ncbi:MAG: hypothetical protein LBL93_01405 [Ruminococcus sp.]|nr:hypothetical protein [Ruminococcus sp.]
MGNNSNINQNNNNNNITPENIALSEKKKQQAVIWGILSIVIGVFGIIFGTIAILANNSAKKLNPNIKSDGYFYGVFGIFVNTIIVPVILLMCLGPVSELQIAAYLDTASQNAETIYFQSKAICQEAERNGASINALVVFDTNEDAEYEEEFFYYNSNSSDEEFTMSENEFKRRIEKVCNFKNINDGKDYYNNAKWMVYIKDNVVISTLFEDYAAHDVNIFDDYMGSKEYVGGFVGSYPRRQSVDDFLGINTTRWIFSTYTLQKHAPLNTSDISD